MQVEILELGEYKYIPSKLSFNPFQTKFPFYIPSLKTYFLILVRGIEVILAWNGLKIWNTITFTLTYSIDPNFLVFAPQTFYLRSHFNIWENHTLQKWLLQYWNILAAVLLKDFDQDLQILLSMFSSKLKSAIFLNFTKKVVKI